MARGIPAYVNHRMLAWARETAGIDRADVAHHLQTTTDRIVAWENGNELPTMRQARILASLYKRPLSLFYFDDPPIEPPRPTDFRVTGRREEGDFPPALRFAIRDAYNRREDATRLLRALGLTAKPFDLGVSLSEKADVVGERMRKWANLTIDEQSKCSEPRVLYNLVRQKLEQNGILTFQMSGIPDETASGFSIAETPLPVISVNSGANPVRRLFTLFHELVHIALQQGGVCDLSSIDGSARKPRVEEFCNRVAGAVLVPREALLSHPIVKGHVGNRPWVQNQIVQLAAQFCVSKYVMLIRLRAVKKATEAYCSQMLSEYRKQEGIESPAASFVRVHDKVASVNGRLFTRLVLDSYFNEQISLVELSNLLDLNLEYLDRLADKIYREAS